MPKITKLRLHLLKFFRENYWLLFSGHGVDVELKATRQARSHGGPGDS